MPGDKPPIWKLIHLCAQQLTIKGITPFRRGDLIACVQLAHPGCRPDSINPIIQGLTDNLRGGAPSGIGKALLHSVGRGRFVLNDAAAANVVRSKICRDQEGRASRAAGLDAPRVPAQGKTATIAGVTFRFICWIEPTRHGDRSIQEFLPQPRFANSGRLQLNRYGRGPFCRFGIPTRILVPGVYVLSVGTEARYIGECVALSSRFNAGYGNISPRNCFVGGQETNCRVNNLVLQIVKDGHAVSLWFHETEDHKRVEAELKAALRFGWNRV